MAAVSRRYDVAVLGLGAMGAAAAYQLTRRGARVVGIDAFSPPHDRGSSHGETRITRVAVGEGDAYVPLAVASHRIWRELERETGERLLVDCGLLLLATGTSGLAVHGQADFLGATAAVAERHRIAHEWLDARALTHRFPAFTPDAATRAYLEPGGGYLIAETCIRAQLGQACRLGAELRTGLRATSITQTGGAVRIATAEGPVLAERAIVATGGWTAPLLGAPFDRLLRVEPQTLHWLASTPEFPAAAPMPAFIWLHGSGAESNFYGFPPLPGAGGLKLATERYGAAVDMNALVREVAPGAAAALHRDHVEGRLKGIAPRALRSSVCAYTVTPDFGFIIDAHPDMDRVMVVSACSGHGFKHSAGIGEALAGALAEGQSPVDLAPFSLARFI